MVRLLCDWMCIRSAMGVPIELSDLSGAFEWARSVLTGVLERSDLTGVFDWVDMLLLETRFKISSSHAMI